MPIGLLVPVLLLALGTLLSLTPLRRPSVAAMVSYRVGLLFDEMPFLAAWLLVIPVLPAIGQGDVDSAGGWALVGFAGLVLAGLGVIAARGLRAPRELAAAMAEGLGPDRRAQPGSPAEGRAETGSRRHWPWARILTLPFLRRRRDVRHIRDLPYGDGGRRNTLDVYHHRGQPTGGPILIHLHGGGYFSGRKDSQALPLLYRLAGQGWVCISANYRLRPAAGFLDHLADAKRVIAWAHEHGPGYGGDSSSLFVSGSSAGAHLSALCALTQNDPAFQPGFAAADTSLAAAICLNGYLGDYGDPDVPSAPADYLRPDAPPFFIAHGTLDTLVPVGDARRFAAALRRASANPVVYAELHGAQHAFDLFHSPRFEAVIDAIEEFAARVRAR